MSTEEHILVIPESVIASIGVIDGFESDVDRFLLPILASDQLSFQPRTPMETDPSFKQLIPYVLLEWTDADGTKNLFTYTRGGGGGEKLGVGAHLCVDLHADDQLPILLGSRNGADFWSVISEIKHGRAFR